MQKIIIGLMSIMFLMVTVACDESKDDSTRGSVPTCGDAVIDADGTNHSDQELFVNWTGPGAPTGPSNNPGFGENGQPKPLNSYTWSLVSFGDHLYAGIANRLNDRHSDTPDTSEGGELWRYEPGPEVNSGTWQKEMTQGFDNPNNVGVRIMAAYNDQLFVGTCNIEQGAELWRRVSDEAASPGQYEKIAAAGFGDKGNNSVRSMAVFNDKLYIGTANKLTGGKIYKFDATTDTLSLVTKIGKGREKTEVVSELVSIGDYLWIFTWGGRLGMSAFRMDRQENIEQASMGSVGADTNNGGIMSSTVFNDKIYVGTVNLSNGAQLFVLENPTVTDLKDVAWNRLGANVFQVTEKYLWRLQVFNGQLYIGTWNPFNFRGILTSYHNIGATLYRMNPDRQFCQVMGYERLIELGFGQSENYGIRSMAEHMGRLFIGTAQIFKIEPGKNDSNAATREGTEVWEFDPSK